jgi:DNA-binding response OmpR family regulator
MPGMSGLDFLRTLREHIRFKRTPVMFITSNGQSDIIAEAINMGIKGYLVKPIDGDKLREKVRSIIGDK